MPTIITRHVSTFPLVRTSAFWPWRDFVPAHDGWSSLAGFLRDFEVEDAAGELRVSLALPGYEAQDIEVRAEGQVLTVHALRRRTHAYGGSVEQVNRCLTLPAGVDTTKAEATLRHGILTVVLPKAEAARRRAIPVRAWWDGTPRPVRTLDLGTLSTRKEERPGFWRRLKEWLVGRGRSGSNRAPVVRPGVR
ncbi:Hsp20/alpha crystallin family protein [Archangium lipolyticum]|uniref:Hsp20/alpha crystallin family protein n=1 Tax=Archangium lipolyticum TaxID=2970465 RepID=UPI00214A7884|nr:Hsp20/alpha crystallin family protein [Archangium lipolyticum]